MHMLVLLVWMTMSVVTQLKASQHTNITLAQQINMTLANESNTTVRLRGVSLLVHQGTTRMYVRCSVRDNCSSVARPHPNYWGFWSQQNWSISGRSIFKTYIIYLKCMENYCCDTQPCTTIDACAPHRYGVLCGRCNTNYSEALLSAKCVSNSSCLGMPFIWVYGAWILLLCCGFLFASDAKDWLKSLPARLKAKWHNSKQDLEAQQQEMQDQETTDPDSEDCETPGAETEELESGNSHSPEAQHSKQEEESTFKYVQIILYFIQDAPLLMVETPGVTSNTSNHWSFLSDISHFAIDVLNFGETVCIWPNMTPIQKIMIKNGQGPVVILLFGLLFVSFSLVSACSQTMLSLKPVVLAHLARGTTMALLLFYQKIATTSMTLLSCTDINSNYHLLIDGTIQCYQIWQMVLFAFIISWVLLLFLVLSVAPGLLSQNKISVMEFFSACFFPPPFLLTWFLARSERRKTQRNKEITPWQQEVTDILQKSFKDVKLAGFEHVCWTGVIKSRRLILILLSTFIENHIMRLISMLTFVLCFYHLHARADPYLDMTANKFFSFSLNATVLLAFINLVKAAMMAGALTPGEDPIPHIGWCDSASNFVVVWAPAAMLLLFLVKKSLTKQSTWLTQKIQTWCSKKV